jgi:PST family polysaccharide transporter
MTQKLPGVADSVAVEGPRAEVEPPRAGAAILWAYALTVGRFGITGVVFVWIATIITPKDFGEMALAMAWVMFAQMLAYCGPAQAVIQRPHASADHFTMAFWLSLAIAVVLAGIFVVMAPAWASLNGEPRIKILCWALAPTIVLNALIVVSDATLKRQMKFKRLSIRMLLAGLVSGAVGVGLALAGYGVWALVAQQITLSVFSAVGVWFSSPWRPSLRLKLSAARDLRSFSLRSIAEFIAHFVGTRTDVLLLGMFFGPAVIGLYRFAVRITDMITELAAGGLSQVSFPHLSRMHENRVAFTEAFSKMIHAGALLAWPTFAVLAASAHEVLALFGSEWLPAAPALQVMCVDAAIGVLGAILAPATQAAGRPGINATVGWIQAAVSAAAIASVGWVFAHGSSPTKQVLAVATTFLVLRLAFMVIIWMIMVRLVFQAPIGRLLAPAKPPLLSAVAALAAGFSIKLVLPSTTALIGALVTASVAAAAAGAVLLAKDPLVRQVARRAVRRQRLMPSDARSS